MNNSEWITDRRPTIEEASPMWLPWGHEVVYLVWIGKDGREPVLHDYDRVKIGTPWKSLTPPEPYVKPKRFEVREAYVGDGFVVIDSAKFSTAIPVPTREAAERILAIYEEVAT